MGTDSGFSVTPYGEWHARELELLMTYAGLSSLEAIQAGTQNGATMLDLEGKVGVVAEGMIADMIVVDGDPVEDINVLQDRQADRDGDPEWTPGGLRRGGDRTRRWPAQRGQRLLRHRPDLRPGARRSRTPHESSTEQPRGWTTTQAKDLVADLMHRETSARLC